MCCRHVRTGAETGAGGRMRDTHATGIGSIMGAGTAGYCVGNLNMEGTPLPGEDPSFVYPESLASPLQVLPCCDEKFTSYRQIGPSFDTF